MTSGSRPHFIGISRGSAERLADLLTLLAECLEADDSEEHETDIKEARDYADWMRIQARR